MAKYDQLPYSASLLICSISASIAKAFDEFVVVEVDFAEVSSVTEPWVQMKYEALSAIVHSSVCDRSAACLRSQRVVDV